MAETPQLLENGLDALPAVKTEPIDPLLDPAPAIEPEPSIIPKEFTVTNGIHEDSDCEDTAFFTQVEVDNTRKCLENTRLIIKDFETQLDWHLQQYMTLRNIYSPKKNSKKDDSSKRQDLLSISQLSAIIANHPEGNKKFIKRKGPISNGAGGRKRRRNKESESEEDSDFSDEDSEEYDEEDFDEQDSEGVDDPTEEKQKPKKTRGRKGKNDDGPVVKDEIEEEIHELVEPKEEMESDEELDDEDFVVKKTPVKKGRQAKAAETKTSAKKGGRVVLNRLHGDSKDTVVEIKDEDMDRDELVELLQTKAIDSVEYFSTDPEKPIVILKQDDVKAFNFNECKASNVIITYETAESFPEFVFTKTVANQVLNGSVKLVQASVFDQHLSKEKN